MAARRQLVEVGWHAVGALGTVGIYGILTIGIPLLVAAVVLAAVLAGSGPVSGAGRLLAIALGAAAALAVLGFLALPYHPCTSRVLVVTAEHPQSGCESLNPFSVYLLPAGILLFAAGSWRALARR